MLNFTCTFSTLSWTCQGAAVRSNSKEEVFQIIPACDTGHSGAKRSSAIVFSLLAERAGGDGVDAPQCAGCISVSPQCHNVAVVPNHFGKTTEALSPNSASSPPPPPSAPHLLAPPSTVLTSWLPGGHKALVCVVYGGPCGPWDRIRNPEDERRQWRCCGGRMWSG